MVLKFSVLGVNISAVNLETAVATIRSWIQERQRVYVCVAPVSTVVAAQDDPEYQRVLNAAALVTPDGMPLVWLARRRGLRQVQRTYGPDLMRKICNEGRSKNYRHFLYGADEATSRDLAEALQRDYPGILIVGRVAPPFRDLSIEETADMLNQINASLADILWVGLGSPKQDFWIAQNRDKLNAPVLIGIGAAFDFLAGTKAQAPRWLQRCGLEWLFRLGCEPRRLWRRYLIGNTRFIYLLSREKFFKTQKSLS